MNAFYYHFFKIWSNAYSMKWPTHNAHTIDYVKDAQPNRLKIALKCFNLAQGYCLSHRFHSRIISYIHMFPVSDSTQWEWNLIFFENLMNKIPFTHIKILDVRNELDRMITWCMFICFSLSLLLSCKYTCIFMFHSDIICDRISIE